MTYQSQQQHAPIHESDFGIEEKKTTTRNDKPTGKLRPILLGLAVVVGIGAFAWTRTFNNSARYIDVNYAPDGYLAPVDYVLIDVESGEPNQDITSIFYEDEYSFMSSYNDQDLMTSKGLKTGDSWEDFVEKYGEYTAYSIYTTHVDSEYDDYSQEDYYSLYDIKVKDYDEQYIKSGIVSLDENYISVSFEFNVKGRDIAFTEDEMFKLYDKKYESNFPPGSIFNPKIQTYSLHFDYEPSDLTYGIEKNCIDYIATYKYVY